MCVCAVLRGADARPGERRGYRAWNLHTHSLRGPQATAAGAGRSTEHGWMWILASRLYKGKDLGCGLQSGTPGSSSLMVTRMSPPVGLVDYVRMARYQDWLHLEGAEAVVFTQFGVFEFVVVWLHAQLARAKKELCPWTPEHICQAVAASHTQHASGLLFLVAVLGAEVRELCCSTCADRAARQCGAGNQCGTARGWRLGGPVPGDHCPAGARGPLLRVRPHGIYPAEVCFQWCGSHCLIKADTTSGSGAADAPAGGWALQSMFAQNHHCWLSGAAELVSCTRTDELFSSQGVCCDGPPLQQVWLHVNGPTAQSSAPEFMATSKVAAGR